MTNHKSAKDAFKCSAYSNSHKYVPFGYGCVCDPQKICLKASTRPHMIDKYYTGGYHKRLREHGPFGAARISWMSAKDLWRIDEGHIIVPADRIRTHTQTI